MATVTYDQACGQAVDHSPCDSFARCWRMIYFWTTEAFRLMGAVSRAAIYSMPLAVFIVSSSAAEEFNVEKMSESELLAVLDSFVAPVENQRNPNHLIEALEELVRSHGYLEIYYVNIPKGRADIESLMRSVELNGASFMMVEERAACNHQTDGEGAGLNDNVASTWRMQGVFSTEQINRLDKYWGIVPYVLKVERLWNNRTVSGDNIGKDGKTSPASGAAPDVSWIVDPRCRD